MRKAPMGENYPQAEPDDPRNVVLLTSAEPRGVRGSGRGRGNTCSLEGAVSLSVGREKALESKRGSVN